MEINSTEASGGMESVIRQIWHTEFSEEEDVNRQDLIMPSGCTNIVFNFLDSYYFLDDNGLSRELPPILLTGQLDRVCRVRYGGNIRQVGIVVTPSGFLSLFGKSFGTYKNTLLDGREKSWNLRPLYDKLSAVRIFPEYEKIIFDYFREYDTEESERLNRILDHIGERSGQVSMKELAEYSHLSESAFVRFFKKTTGITPKAYSNIIRFKNSLKNIRGDDPGELYYDQSHFIKSCKKFTGKTPSELRKGAGEITLGFMLEKG